MDILKEIQKSRYTNGAVVLNTNNCNYGIVLDGSRGNDSDPVSLILEFGSKVFLNSPPNRALIPTGKFHDVKDIRGYFIPRKGSEQDD